MRLLLLAVILSFIGCSVEETPVTQEPEVVEENITQITDTICTSSEFRKIGFIYENNDETYLWAGVDTSTHFNIDNWELNECNLRYGLGRENFPALLEPQYVSISDFTLDLDPIANCVVVFSSDKIKVYPYEVMRSYEAINEVHNGNPIMIAYCVLADLAAVYTRDYCGNTLTFGVSGYTYFDKNIWGGIDAFLLWDRDTESLWWPLVDRAISGSLKGQSLEKYNEALWEILSWDEIKKQYPEALVLNTGQSQNPPGAYPLPDPSIYNCR